jgi:hypothetical protein
MKRLSKLQAFLLVFVIPTILRLITLPVDNLAVLTIVTVLTYGLISLWYYGLLTTIKQETEITRSEELIIKAFLTLLFIYPVLAMILFKEPQTGIPISLIIGNLTFAGLGLISLYLLTLGFEKVLKIRNEKENRLLIFILLAVYPIGIWKFHNKITLTK